LSLCWLLYSVETRAKQPAARGGPPGAEPSRSSLGPGQPPVISGSKSSRPALNCTFVGVASASPSCSTTEISCEPQSPNSSHVKLPISPAKPDVADNSSRSACRSIFRLPSPLSTATASIADSNMIVASYEWAQNGALGASPYVDSYVARKSVGVTPVTLAFSAAKLVFGPEKYIPVDSGRARKF